MKEETIITLYIKTFSSPGSSSMMHRQIQCYFQLLAVLTQPVSEGALDGYTEANHKIEIHYSTRDIHSLEWFPSHMHIHDKWIMKN